MEFGRVTEEELAHIDFTLPPEPIENKTVLSGGKPLTPTDIRIGCAKWGRKEWIGKIYPKGTKEGDFLKHYVHHYNSIELNATHYKIYDEVAISKWARQADGLDFKFCPKVPQLISHYSSFQNVEDKTTEFLKGISAFKEHLGPVFLQVSENFSPKRRDSIFKYLESLPKDIQFFLEVRHHEWFSDEGIEKELFDVLAKNNVGAVITDTSSRRDCAHMRLAIPKTFVRYVGNSLHPTDYTRIDDWVARIKYWIDNGLQELYFFMHMHDESYSPELTVYLVDKLNTIPGVELKKPKFIESLF